MKRYTITVPSLKRNGTPIFKELRAQVLNHVVEALTKEAGGTTMYTATGTYEMATGTVATEPVTVVEVYAKTATMRVKLLVLADFIKRELDQEAVFITSKGVGELV